MRFRRFIPGVAILMLLVAASNLGIILDDSNDIESMLTSARDDDDYCEENYSSEAACNADSRCEWDAEDDPSDDDYPGECEEAEDEDEEEDDDDDDELTDDSEPEEFYGGAKKNTDNKNPKMKEIGNFIFLPVI